MKKSVGIATDSYSGISSREAERLGIKVLAMPFYVNGECFYENQSLSRDEFFQRLQEGADVKTSQPSPAAVIELWDEMLEEYEELVYIPMSSGLSGSCMTAQGLAGEEAYEGRVFVADVGRVATPMHRSVLDALELAAEGFSAEEIRDALEESRDRMVIYVGLQTLEHLKRGGRISASAQVIGTILNIKPVMKFDVGTLDVYKKCRGFSRAREAMIEAMRQELAGRFKEEQAAGEVFLMAASSASEEETKRWVQEIEAAFPGMNVACDPLTLGLCCHIGQGGLGIGCSCRVKRPLRK
ncbi:MAG: DegV family protein [Clostridium sp.]